MLINFFHGLRDAGVPVTTRELLDLARDSAEGRLVSTLEGGYDLEALSTAPRAHVEALLKGRGLAA